MPSKKYKNVLAPIPVAEYNKLKYISELVGISMPELMKKIIDTPFFTEAVEATFELMTNIEKEKTQTERSEHINDEGN